MRIVLLGNAGAGKTTLARHLMGGEEIYRLSLDEIAWGDGVERRPLADSLALLEEFMGQHDQWIIEGCYSDLVAAALPHCTELIFLNPGVETCVTHCLARPWEPDKFTTPEEQQAMLDGLVAWVRDYETRDDEYGLQRHRRLFDYFPGAKRELNSAADYAL